MNTTYKVGDRVKIVSKSSEMHGMTGTVGIVHQRPWLGILLDGIKERAAFSVYEVEKIEEQFKVGDKVKITRGEREGRVAVVDKVHPWGGPLSLSLKFGGEAFTLAYSPSEVGKITAETEPAPAPLKIGDRVKVIEPRTRFTGLEGEIVTMHPDLSGYYDFTVKLDGNGDLGFNADELEKVEPEPTPAFNVGDKVRITNATTYFAGRTGVVTSVAPLWEKKSYGIRMDNNNGVFGFFEDEIELRPADPEPLKIGDRVKITSIGENLNGATGYVVSIDSDRVQVVIDAESPAQAVHGLVFTCIPTQLEKI